MEAASFPSLQHCNAPAHHQPTPIASQLQIVEPPMDTPRPSESASSSLPWLWIIQAAAVRKEIHISTLQDFVNVAPVEHDDYCEKTRELIALRCLEEIFYSALENNCDDVSASLGSRVGFDFSSSCEDVLQQILDEIPLSNLKKDRAELLKWDVFPFLRHKRATAECYMEQLKESISEGAHPYINFRERRGLVHQNGGYPVTVGDLSEKDNGNCSYSENTEAKENSDDNVMGYQHEKQMAAELVNSDGNFSCEANLLLAVIQGNTDEIQKEILEQHKSVQTEESDCVLDAGKEEAPKEDDESPIISTYARRFRRHGTNRKA